MTRPVTIIGILLLLLAGIGGGYLLGLHKRDGSAIMSGAGKQESAETQLYTCGMHPFYVQEGPGTCPICGMNLTPKKETKKTGERKIKYWQAPMDPSYISDKPGKSPMGMDLVPVYEDEAEAEEGDLVVIDPVVVQNIGVKTETIKRRTLDRMIRTVARITYDERKISHVHTKFTGWIEELYVNFTGQLVEKGQPLISIYSPELVSTQKEYLQALQYRDRLKNSGIEGVRSGGEALLEATRRRLELWDITDAQINHLEKTGEVRKTMTLYSSIHGIVVHMEGAREGMYIQPGMNLYTIADISYVWVVADIFEYELPWVRVGQEATMSLSYAPGNEYRGRITFIDPFVDPETRTVQIRMEFGNPDFELKPDMYANVVIYSNVTKEGIAVPIQAVIHSGKRNVVIIDRGEGRFEPRTVRLGPQAEGYYHVVEGVRAGEKVVTSAQFLIDSESNLKAALSMMTAPETDEIPLPDPDLDMSDMTMDDIEPVEKSKGRKVE